MKKTIKSMEEFYKTYLPKTWLQKQQESKLKTIHVCPECESRHLHWVEHDTYGYYLCYGCGWSSMTPSEIGSAMAKESIDKIEFDLKV